MASALAAAEDFFDFRDRVVGEVLGDLADHLAGDDRMEFLAQFAQNAGSGAEDDVPETVVVRVFVERFGGVPGETVLCEAMPVGFLDGAALAASRGANAAGTVSSLLAVGGIFLLHLPHDLEIRRISRAGIFEEQR